VLPTEQSRPDIAFKRARWKAHQNKIDPKRLIFIDETWIKTNMAPLRGWGPVIGPTEFQSHFSYRRPVTGRGMWR
jgi:hypothetical protein